MSDGRAASWWTGGETNQVTVLANVQGHISSVRVHVYIYWVSPTGYTQTIVAVQIHLILMARMPSLMRPQDGQQPRHLRAMLAARRQLSGEGLRCRRGHALWSSWPLLPSSIKQNANCSQDETKMTNRNRPGS